jgi:hypothetical protein
MPAVQVMGLSISRPERKMKLPRKTARMMRTIGAVADGRRR